MRRETRTQACVKWIQDDEKHGEEEVGVREEATDQACVPAHRFPVVLTDLIKVIFGFRLLSMLILLALRLNVGHIHHLIQSLLQKTLNVKSGMRAIRTDGHYN